MSKVFDTEKFSIEELPVCPECLWVEVKGIGKVLIKEQKDGDNEGIAIGVFALGGDEPVDGIWVDINRLLSEDWPRSEMRMAP